MAAVTSGLDGGSICAAALGAVTPINNRPATRIVRLVRMRWFPFEGRLITLIHRFAFAGRCERETINQITRAL